MKKPGILFDCDGTLIDSEDQVIKSVHYALKMTNSPLRSSKEIKNLFGPGVDKILMTLIGEEKKAQEAFEYYIESQKKLASSMRVYDGIRELLETLKANEFSLGVVTGRHSSDLELVLKAHQLNHFFDVIISDDYLYNPKPHSEGILKASIELKIDIARLYYVGDAKTDMEAAHKANVKGIAALWDKRVDPVIMKLEKPFFMADSPMDIWRKLSSKEVPADLW